jgi:hypothetical protein
MTRRRKISEDRSKIREEKGSLVIRAVMKEAVSFMIKMGKTREEDDSQKALEASRDRLLDLNRFVDKYPTEKSKKS